MAGAPALAIVVLSHGPRKTLAAAVQSLLAQDTAAEIIVVHSGSGDVKSALGAVGADVRIVESAARLLPGGARNLGISETQAPFVAFLADDCMAQPGWVRNRVAAHMAGAAAVSSALICHQPGNPVALAAHLSLYVRRMPRASPAVALCYGVSYARALFDRHGLFRADIESGEDTEFNQRLLAADAPIWAPEICTMHVGSDTIAGFLGAQLRRGRRMAQAWAAIGDFDAAVVARNALERTGMVVRESWNAVEPAQRMTMLASAPLIVLGNVVYAWGAWRCREQRT